MIDGAVNGVGRAFRGIGGGLRKVQTGLVRNYALAIVLGAVLARRVRDHEGDAVIGASRPPLPRTSPASASRSSPR